MVVMVVGVYGVGGGGGIRTACSTYGGRSVAPVFDFSCSAYSLYPFICPLLLYFSWLNSKMILDNTLVQPTNINKLLLCDL